MAITLATDTRTAMADACVDLADAGEGAAYVDILDVDGETVLASIELADPSFGDAVAGVATALGVPKSALAIAAGIATTFRLYNSDDAEVFRGSVGLDPPGTADAIITNVNLNIGDPVGITAFTFTQPSGA